MEDKKKKEEKKQEPEFMIDDRELPQLENYIRQEVRKIMDEWEIEEKNKKNK